LRTRPVKSSESKSSRLRRSLVAISRDWNGWQARLDLHLSRGLFCTMEFKRSRSPTIFAPSLYRRYGPDGWMTAVWRFAGIGQLAAPLVPTIACYEADTVKIRTRMLLKQCARLFMDLVFGLVIGADGPTVEYAVVAESIPQHVVLNRGASLPEGPVAESHTTRATKRAVIIEMLRPLIFATTSKDRQVRM